MKETFCVSNTIKKTSSAGPGCTCSSGCTSKRCACRRGLLGCSESCRCAGCRNPLNGVDASVYSPCVLDHFGRVKDLTENELTILYRLPCDERAVQLKELLTGYTCPVNGTCPGCEGTYQFSFCWNTAIESSHTRHCRICGTCFDWRFRHCESCNRCSYGQSLPCEHCGSRKGMDDDK